MLLPRLNSSQLEMASRWASRQATAGEQAGQAGGGVEAKSAVHAQGNAACFIIQLSSFCAASFYGGPCDIALLALGTRRRWPHGGGGGSIWAGAAIAAYPLVPASQLVPATRRSPSLCDCVLQLPASSNRASGAKTR